MGLWLIAIILWVGGVCRGWCQATITADSTGYYQNFNRLGNKNGVTYWLDQSQFPEWYLDFRWYKWGYLCESQDEYIASDGSPYVWWKNYQGAIYSYGENQDTDRALGSYTPRVCGNNSTSATGILRLQLKNSGTTSIKRIEISYQGELWHYGGAQNDQLTFSFGILQNSQTNFVAIPELSYSPQQYPTSTGATDGNTYTTSVSYSFRVQDLGLGITQIDPNESFWLKWVDSTVGIEDNGLAIDELHVRAYSTVPEPSTYALGISGELLFLSLLRRFFSPLS